MLTVGIPFLIDSYIFSPVPWKGKDPLRRMKRTTPEKKNKHIFKNLCKEKIINREVKHNVYAKRRSEIRVLPKM